MGKSTFDLSLKQVAVVYEALKWAVDQPSGIETLPILIVTDPQSNAELGSIIVDKWGQTRWTPNTVLTDSN